MSSFSSRGRNGRATHAHDVKTKSGLNSLYNERVVSAQVVTRNLPSSSSGFGKVSGVNLPAGRRLRHEGVKLTTQTGKEVLVHSGRNYGKSGSDGVAVNAKHMAKGNWSKEGQAKNIAGGRSVGDYVSAANKNKEYSLWSNNCQHTTRNMMSLDKKKSATAQK